MIINKKNTILEKSILLGILIILVLPFVSAIGVSSLYTGSESPLKLLPGEEKIVVLELQNWDGEDELTLKGEVLVGTEIAYLKESTIRVPYQQKIPVEMVVKASADAKIGDVYKVEYIFRQVPGQENNGTISFTQSITRNFDVVIVEEQVAEPAQPAVKSGISKTVLILVVVGIIIIIIAIIWILMRRKK